MLSAILLCAVGLVALVIGAELVVRGGAQFASHLGISPLTVGVTVVAVGTSAPELAVGIDAALSDAGPLAVGNIVGTNTVNILFILGLSALIDPLKLRRQTVQFDLPVIVLVSLLLLGMSWDGLLDRFDGAVMVVGALCYTAAILWLARREGRAVQAEFADDLVLEYGVRLLDRSQFIRSALKLAAGIAIIVIGADWLVDGGVALARLWGVSDAFIGLTIVALGTSSPELVTAIVSTIRKERDIAVGNLIGSSVYNILAILGITSLAPASGVPVTPELIRVDIPVMVATGFACVPVFLSGMRVTRGEGALFVGAYLLYLTYLIVSRA